MSEEQAPTAKPTYLTRSKVAKQTLTSPSATRLGTGKEKAHIAQKPVAKTSATCKTKGSRPVKSSEILHDQAQAGSSTRAHHALLESLDYMKRNDPPITGDFTLAPPSNGTPLPLRTVLRTAPPKCPPVYKKNALVGTRAPTMSEVRVNVAFRLDKVVVYEPLVRQLLGAADELIDELVVDVGQVDHHTWLSSVHPAYTSRNLPLVLHNEHDVEAWVFSVLIRPAVAAIKAHMASKDTPAASKSTVAFKHVTDGQFPNVGSAGGKESIPDGILWDADKNPQSTYELKSPSIVGPQSLKSRKYRILSAPLLSWPSMPVGRAMKFNWPGKRANVNSFDTETRVIMQIWCQMLEWNVEYAMLSSFSSTIFFVKRGDTLFLSREILREDRPLHFVFAFLALSLGCISRDKLILPEVNTTWWPKDIGDPASEGYTGPGIDLRTLPNTYWGEIEGPSEKSQSEGGPEDS
ncbi:hypothetical protein BD410DRAFT_837666 [Rickenella mellea]|uniref:Uncharacterized protein n=1 Tax=Rickenella mellea TaxID=50990 RepID=A0A4Y7QBH2_9AGAM|nr:hypothetical protein BD410DRAFT_837666 [Rickenella mellea]